MADVVVVGAGFAGLSAAARLKEAGVGFTLLEARTRVGGRVEAASNGLGERIDVGGQFLCEDMPVLMALAREHGVHLVETPVEGDFTIQPRMDMDQAELTYAGGLAIRRRMKRLDPADAAIAGLRVADWLALQDDGPGAKHAFRSMIEGLWCRPLEEIPLWYLVSNDRRVTNQTSELQYFPRETMHALADRMAAAIGDALHPDAAASSIEHAGDGVRVTSKAGRFDGRLAIVAAPPVAAGRIDFRPELSPETARSLRAWRSGTVIKGFVRYARPFWRAKGLSGMVMWRDVHGLFVCDASPDDAHAMLVVFIGGPLAERWRALGGEGLRSEILGRLTAALGAEAGDVLDVVFRDWCDDPWSGGAYSDVVIDIDATDAEAVLRRGEGRILFASSELSPAFPGYVEGAIIAGRAAADAAIARLRT